MILAEDIALKNINVGVIGTGWCGGIRANVCAASALVKDLYIAEIKPERLEEVKKQTGARTATPDYRDLLKIDEIDAYIVSTTPEPTHYPIARDCLLAGKHVLLEKPIALALEEADDLIAIAREKNLKFTIGYSQRFNHKFAYVKKSLNDGTVGKPVSAVVSRHITRALGNKISGRVRLSPAAMEATHDIDFVLWCLEPAKPIRVYSQSAFGVMKATHDTADTQWIMITMDNGVVVTIGAGWTMPPGYPNYSGTWIEFVATDGMLVVDDTHRDVVVNTMQNGIQLPMSSMPGEQVEHVYAGPMANETIHFLEAVVYDRPVMVKPEHARLVMEVYMAADISAERNEMVNLPLPEVPRVSFPLSQTRNSELRTHNSELGTRVDIHTHFMPRKVIDEVRSGDALDNVTIQRRDGKEWVVHRQGHRYPLAPEFWDLEAKLQQMDRLGIDISVLSIAPSLLFYWLEAGPAQEFCQRANNALAEFVSQSDGRLYGLAAVPLQDPEAAVAELRRAVLDLGFKGTQIGTTMEGIPLDDPRFDTFFATAEELDVPVILHPYYVAGKRAEFSEFYMINLISYPLSTGMAASRLILSGFLDRHPDLKLVLVHGGGFMPFQVGRLDHGFRVRAETKANIDSPPSSYLRRFHYDTITHASVPLKFLVELVGADRVVLGTDIPFDMADLRFLEYLAAAEFDEQTLQAINGGNSSHLFALEDRSKAVGRLHAPV